MNRAEIAAKLSALLVLAYQVNCETKYAVFCDFSGHVNWVSLRVRRGKEKEASLELLFDQYVNLDRDGDLGRIDEWMVYLNRLLGKSEMPAIPRQFIESRFFAYQ